MKVGLRSRDILVVVKGLVFGCINVYFLRYIQNIFVWLCRVISLLSVFDDNLLFCIQMYGCRMREICFEVFVEGYEEMYI